MSCSETIGADAALAHCQEEFGAMIRQMLQEASPFVGAETLASMTRDQLLLLARFEWPEGIEGPG